MADRAVITLMADTSEGRRRFGVFADAMKDVNSVLRAFDDYKRGKIAELFATQGHGEWPARSDRSEGRGKARAKAAAERAPRTLLLKLKREHVRAEKRLAKLDPHAFENARKLHSGRNAVARRAFAVKAFESAVEGVFIAPEDKKQEKVLAKLAPRWERAQARAARKGNVLGNLPQTIQSSVRGGLLTIDSAWKSPAPAVLQWGGKVGRGAEVPERIYLEWTAEDIEVLVNLFKTRAMLAWSS